MTGKLDTASLIQPASTGRKHHLKQNPIVVQNSEKKAI